jgi:hypothetical protein
LCDVDGLLPGGLEVPVVGLLLLMQAVSDVDTATAAKTRKAL